MAGWAPPAASHGLAESLRKWLRHPQFKSIGLEDGDPTYSGAIDKALTATVVTVDAAGWKTAANSVVVAISATTDGSGEITVSYGKTIVGALPVAVVKGTTAHHVQVVSATTTDCVLRFFTMAGANLTTTAVTANLFVRGS